MRKILTILIILSSVLSVSAFDFDLEKQDSGLLTAREGNVLRLNFEEKEHQMAIDRVGSQRIMMTLTPGNNVLIMDLNQEKEIDLDKDGVNDVKIILKSILDKEASLRLEKIQVDTNNEITGDVVGGEAPNDENKTDDGTTAPPEIEETPFTLNKWIIGGVVGVIIIIILVFLFRGGENTDKLYNKAMDLHREGQEFHWDGDEETAEELYDKANEFREKARNEGGF